VLNIFNLKWSAIDIKNDIIHLLYKKNGQKREVHINKQAKTALIRTRKHPESPYVFCKADGSQYGHVRKSFFTALKKSGIVSFRFLGFIGRDAAHMKIISFYII
jgi:integrase